jgi:hypothetical protein
VIVIISLVVLSLALPVQAQTVKAPDTEALRAGRNCIATPVYSEAADKAGRRELYKKAGLKPGPSIKI